jgi:amino acid permease
MKRFFLALAFGAVITTLPWILRPLFGDHSAILWLPGFAAISHWFPAGLHSKSGATAKAAGCSLNTLIWTAAFLLVSYSVQASTNPRAARQERHE